MFDLMLITWLDLFMINLPKPELTSLSRDLFSFWTPVKTAIIIILCTVNLCQAHLFPIGKVIGGSPF